MKEFKKARARCIWLDVDDLCSFVPVADHVSTGSAATAENIVESDADAPSVTAHTDVPAEKNAPLKRNRKSSENSDADELCSEKDGSTDVNPPADAPSVTAHTDVPAEKNSPLQRNGKSSEDSGSKSSRNNDDDTVSIEEDGSTDVNPAIEEDGSTDVNPAPADRYMRCVTYDTATTYGRSSIVFCTPGVASVVMYS
jgi:hypothetical protein